VSAIKSGSVCFCLDKLPTNHLAHTEDACDVPCPGDSYKMCGGEEAYDFYVASKMYPGGIICYLSLS
jgi:hypothetical protein